MMKGEKQRGLELPVRLESRGLSVPDQGLLEQNRLLLYKHCKKGAETQGGIGGGIVTGAVEGRKVVQATCRGLLSAGDSLEVPVLTTEAGGGCAGRASRRHFEAHAAT